MRFFPKTYSLPVLCSRGRYTCWKEMGRGRAGGGGDREDGERGQSCAHHVLS